MDGRRQQGGVLASTPAFAEDCKLTHTDNNGKTFKFDLTRSVKGVGSIVSEKGHYSTNLTASFGVTQQYWFQMCDLMSFSKQDQKAADSPHRGRALQATLMSMSQTS